MVRFFAAYFDAVFCVMCGAFYGYWFFTENPKYIFSPFVSATGVSLTILSGAVFFLVLRKLYVLVCRRRSLVVSTGLIDLFDTVVAMLLGVLIEYWELLIFRGSSYWPLLTSGLAVTVCGFLFARFVLFTIYRRLYPVVKEVSDASAPD